MIADCKWNKNEDNWNETETVQELTSTEQNCSSNDNPPSIKYKSEYIVSQNVPAESLDEVNNLSIFHSLN